MENQEDNLGSKARTLPRKLVRDFICAITNAEADISNFYLCVNRLDKLSMSDFKLALAEVLNNQQFDGDSQLIAAIMLIQIELSDHIDFSDSQSIRFLLNCLDSNDANLRCHTAIMLAQYSCIPDQIIPSLVRLFYANIFGGRFAAATSLMIVKPETLESFGKCEILSEAVKELSIALLGDNLALASIAANILVRCGVRTDYALQTLIDALSGTSSASKLSIIYLLGNIGYAAIKAVPSLMAMLEDRTTTSEIRLAIIRALPKIVGNSAADKESARALSRAIRSENWLNVCLAVKSLQEMQIVPKSAIARLIRMLSDINPATRSLAALTLGELGTQAEEAVPSLVERLEKEENTDVIWSLMKALIGIGRPAIPAMIKVLERLDLRTASMASIVLTGIGADAAEIVTNALMTHADARIRRGGAEILKEMGPRAAAVVPALLQILQGQDEDKRIDAILALMRIGPEGRNALPLLIDAISDNDPYVSKVAGDAIYSIGVEAIPALRQARQLGLSSKTHKLIDDLLARLEPSVVLKQKALEFTWIGDDRLIALFVEVGRILREHGPMGIRTIAKAIASNPNLAFGIPTSEQNIRTRLRKLEMLLAEKEGRTITLTQRNARSRRPGGLTADGERLLSRMQTYLEEVDRAKSSIKNI